MGWLINLWFEDLLVTNAWAVDNLGVYGRHGWDVPISAFSEQMILVRQFFSSKTIPKPQP